jgi:hypothetical protein
MTDLAQLADARRALEPERTTEALARAFELWRPCSVARAAARDTPHWSP